jgi:membrane protein
VLRDSALTEQIMAQVTHLLPTRGDVVGTVIAQVVAARGTTGVLGMLTLLWTGSGFFSALEASINHIAGTRSKRHWWRRRIIAIIMAILMAPLLILATLLSTLNNILTARLTAQLTFLPAPLLDILTTGMNQVLTLFLAIASFAALYYWLPRRRPPLTATLIGAMAGGAVWVGLTYVFTWYLGSGLATYNLIYGPITTVIVLVLWLYLTSAIILLGAMLAMQIGARNLSGKEGGGKGQVS